MRRSLRHRSTSSCWEASPWWRTVDARTLRSGLNFTLRTEAGDIDLLGEVTGVGQYEEAARGAIPMELFGRRILVVSLDVLERSKRAVGRAKDLLDLEAIRELRRRGG